MKIGLLESYIEWENKEVNMETLQAVLQQVVSENLDVIFLPEMSFTGFSMNTKVTKDNNKETVNRMCDLSRQYDMAIGFGWVSGDEKAENHYSVVSHGKELLDYRKIHPFSYSGEHQYFQGGDSLCCCQLHEFTLGALICYDLRFPEVFQILSQKADFIVVPANWPEKRREHWKVLLQARAIENQCYVAGINCFGAIGGLSYSGDSCLINPNGEFVKPYQVLTVGKNHLYLFEPENDVARFRQSFPTKQDRKEELYKWLECRYTD